MSTGSAPFYRTDRPGNAPSGRLNAPAAERNTEPIVATLRPILGAATGRALEIGSGTGQHAAALAGAFPALDWQPSDPADAHLVSSRAWAAHAALPNLREPIRLDAAEDWPDLGPLAVVLAVNVIHIAPWRAAEGVMRGAARALAPDGALIFYGPFREGGRHTGEGNVRFDATLRANDPEWGVRELDDVSALADRAGFGAPAITPMPANNRLVAYRRR